MPIKKAAKAKAKAKGVIKKSPIKAAKFPKAAEESAIVDGPARKLARRDTDDQVDRACERKLAFIPKRIWVGKLNPQGQTVEQVVEKEIYRVRNDGGYIQTKFWIDLIIAFDLVETSQDILTAPEDDDIPPPKELLEVLECLYNENRIKCVVWPLEGFLAYSEALTPCITYGLLRATLPSPKLDRLLAAKAHVAIMRFWSRTKSGIVGDRTHDKMQSYSR